MSSRGGPLVRWDGGSRRFHFNFTPPEGGQFIAFQVTVKGAGGSKDEAERICRLCAARFGSGLAKEEVIAFRESLYREVTGAAPEPWKPAAASGSAQPGARKSRSGRRRPAPAAQEEPQGGPAARKAEAVERPRSRSGIRRRPSGPAEPKAHGAKLASRAMGLRALAKRRSGIRRKPSVPSEDRARLPNPTLGIPAPAKRRSGTRRKPIVPAEPDADDVECVSPTREDAGASDADVTLQSPVQFEQQAAGYSMPGPCLRWDKRHQRYHFKSLRSEEGVQCQVTVKAAGGNRAEAARICRLCMAKFESGGSREEVFAYRDSLYKELAGGPAAPRRLSTSRPEAGAEEKPKPRRQSGKRRPRSELAAMEAQREAEAVEPPPKKRRSGIRRPKESAAPPEEKDDVDLEYASQMREWEQAEQSGLNVVDEVASAAVSAALCTVIETSALRTVPAAHAAKTLVDGIQLNSDVVLPVVGFGTYKLKKGDCLEPVLKALQVGYRLIDTAQIYENEGDVGEALRQSGIPRDRLCLETKHWRSSHGYERTLKACKGSLSRLGVDYIDLYLIHWPGCKTGWPLPRGACSPPDWTPSMRDEGTWRAMEQLYQEGKVKALGVSNYSIRHLQTLLKMCRVRPSVNQVEFHPWLVQSELLEFCKQEGIVLQAYASLGSGDVSSRADFFALKPVREAAKTHDKTSAQILLRWAMDKGITVLPKSKSTDRMVENFGVFDFKLSAAEVAAIDKCHRGHRFAWKHLDPDKVP